MQRLIDNPVYNLVLPAPTSIATYLIAFAKGELLPANAASEFKELGGVVSNEFYNLSNVPVLFNTSFNLAGEPLVETLEDAIKTLRNSKIEYLYLPELGKLVTIANED